MKKSLQNTFFKSIVSLFAISLIGTIIINSTLSYIDFSSQKKKIKEEIINSKKEIMKNQVEFMVSDIATTRAELENEVRKDLKAIVETAYNIADNLYKTQKDNPNIQETIVESLRKLKFFDITNQYVFMTKLDGTFLLVDGLKHLEGKNVFDLATKSNKKSIRDIIAMLREKKAGYYEYLWQDYITLKFEKKLSYFKYFEPFDCYIGTGIFTFEIEDRLKENFIEKINDYKFGEQMKNYMFAATYDGYSLTYPAKGKNVYDIEDKNGLKIVQELIKKAKNGGGYISYTLPLGNQKDVEKISYVKGIDPWGLYIGVGEILEDIDSIIKKKKDELFEDMLADIVVIISFGVLFFILFYMFFNRIRDKLTADISRMNQSLENLVSENIKIKRDDIEFEEFDTIASHANKILNVKKDVESELKRKELMLHQQSKMASMGDMLENIAHQWRQPLSVITISSTGILIKKEYEDLEDEYLEEMLNAITENATYLSNTIDDFRNFFLSDKKIDKFVVGEVIETSLKLVSAKFKNRDINIIKNIENIEIEAYKNELIQVLLIILNNAKDVLEEIENEKYIFIDVFQKDTNVFIEFKDNGGGIKDENLPKIFEPYFTTKHKSQGTGIGLYMAREIISKHMNGDIEVKNEEYIYNKIKYIGAKFSFIIPIEV